jgi:signal transduction histidine kinase
MDVFRSLAAEPRVPDPPGPGRRDWALIAVFAPVAVLEAAFAEDRPWPTLSAAVVVALLPTLLWRRTHPLATVALAFGAFALVDAASIAAGVDWEGLSVGAFVLLLLYALFRWGSGREAVAGLAVTIVPIVLSVSGETPVSDVLGGTLFLLFVCAVGASVRYQENARTRGMDQVKLREREVLARELHDTVAHHVSAIAIQAQAGRAVAAARSDTALDSALDALGVIEEEASRTLDEMRTMVGALRQGDEADLFPQRGVADIERLAGGGDTGLPGGGDTGLPGGGDTAEPGDRPRVDVELSGDLDGLWPPVDAALYRLAQESITNARRHARHAERIRVRVAGEGDCVRLTVSDDGDATGGAAPSGYGLVGMTERAHLLGGTLEAGPNRDGGWTVKAVLPRHGSSHGRDGVAP